MGKLVGRTHGTVLASSALSTRNGHHSALGLRFRALPYATASVHCGHLNEPLATPPPRAKRKRTARFRATRPALSSRAAGCLQS